MEIDEQKVSFLVTLEIVGNPAAHMGAIQSRLLVAIQKMNADVGLTPSSGDIECVAFQVSRES